MCGFFRKLIDLRLGTENFHMFDTNLSYLYYIIRILFVLHSIDSAPGHDTGMT
jgi:hypothetical protein